MKNTLFIGDLHLRIAKFKESVALLEWIEVEVARVKPEVVVYLGDTFDTHANMRSEVVDIFTSHLARVSNKCGGIIHLLGNHEMVRQDSYKHHALTCLKYLPNVEVVDEPRVIDGAGFIPYVHDSSLFPRLDSELGVAHQTFLGSQYSGFRPKEGVDVSQIGCELVVSGHIHERQVFDSVIYPGTPMASSLSDVNQDKGIMLMDRDTLRYSFIESPFPKYKTFDLYEENPILPVFGQDIYVIKLIGSKVFCSSFLSTPEVKNAIEQGVCFRPQYTDTKKVDKVSISSKKSIKEMAEEYIDKVLSSKEKSNVKQVIKDL